MRDDLGRKIEELEKKKESLLHGTLIYKTIKGKKQPYLQWTEKGVTKSKFIKTGEREQILELVEERKHVSDELHRLRTYYDGIRHILAKQPFLANQVSIGYQDYAYIREHHLFYVDKTEFLSEWWNDGAQVTLITRPRRFGKTLTLHMTECFFSMLYESRGDLFENTKIWNRKEYRELQGTWPVVFLSFADVKSSNFQDAAGQICECILDLYEQHRYLLKSGALDADDIEAFKRIRRELSDHTISACKSAVKKLCRWLYLHTGKKVIVLIDEYDTPITEGYMNGYLEQMTDLVRNIFHSALKTNRYLHRALMTGISRISRESLFSDLNHLLVISATSEKYAESFGFTESEVFDALQCQNIEEKEKVRDWYDGFTFGGIKDIYNPWSVTNYLHSRQFMPYWANSGGYGLISRLLLQGNDSLKEDFAILQQGGSIWKSFQEAITFDRLEQDENAIWSLLFASGYLRADHVILEGATKAELSVTNRETMIVFDRMIQEWFLPAASACQGFCKYLLEGDVELMNEMLENITMEMMSFFDAGRRPGEKEPERFYHGLVLGLIADLRNVYMIRSNRESGYGRYDIMMIPVNKKQDAILIEFKVRDEKREKNLEETVQSALLQIEEKQYETELLNLGIKKEHIRKYGFAFQGKKVLIGENQRG